jgi:hypothetical protein
MAKFSKLQEEEIKIDIQDTYDENIIDSHNSLINIVLRNPKNEDLKYLMDLKKIFTIKDLKREVYKL